MSNLRKQTVHSIKWLLIASFSQKIISFCVTIILARILGPYDFGLFTLSLVVVSSFDVFKSLGMDSALIQRKNDISKAANTAFFIIPLLGLFLYLVLFLSAPLIGSLLNKNELINTVRVLGVIFVISCFAKVPSALLERDIHFTKVSLVEIVSSFVFSTCALGFAVIGCKVWALIFAYIAKTSVYMIMVWIFVRWKPSLEFDKKIALEMFCFGKFLLLGGVFWFIKMNLDNVLVGKILGIHALGLYAVAFNIANFASDYFGIQIHRVTFPVFSKLQDNLEGLRKASLETFKYIAIFAIPFGIGVFLLGEEFLKFSYGQKWLGAIGVLKILAFAGIFNTLPAGFFGIFLACGKPRLGFQIILFQVVMFFLFIVPIANVFGINGVGAVVTATSFFAFLITLIWAMKLLSFNLKHVYYSLKPALISSLFMTLGIILFKNILYQHNIVIKYIPNGVVLFIFALSVYCFSLFKLERSSFREIKAMIF